MKMFMTTLAMVMFAGTANAELYVAAQGGTELSNIEDSNLTGTLAVGKNFGNFRGEVQFLGMTSRDNFSRLVGGSPEVPAVLDKDGVVIEPGVPAEPGEEIGFQADVSTQAVMAVGYLDFGTGKLRPFVGLGGGIILGDEDPVGQGTVGVSFNMTDNLALTGSYMYLSDFDDYETGSVLAGLRVTF